jgi:hypothetical protein
MNIPADLPIPFARPTPVLLILVGYTKNNLNIK